MAEALDDVEIEAPAVPLVANVRAHAVSDPATIRTLLVEQVTGAVRWRESVEWMAAQGVTEFWEIGAGKALSGMIRRIAKEAETPRHRDAGGCDRGQGMTLVPVARPGRALPSPDPTRSILEQKKMRRGACSI